MFFLVISTLKIYNLGYLILKIYWVYVKTLFMMPFDFITLCNFCVFTIFGLWDFAGLGEFCEVLGRFEFCLGILIGVSSRGFAGLDDFESGYFDRSENTSSVHWIISYS